MSRSREGTWLTTRSPIRITPSLIDSRPASIRSAVVFPQPDGPTSTISCPSGIVRSSSDTARVPSGYTLLVRSKATVAKFRLRKVNRAPRPVAPRSLVAMSLNHLSTHPHGYDFPSGRRVRRHIRLVVPNLEARFLSGRDAAARAPALLRRAPRHRRAEHDRIPAARGGAVPALGGRDAGRLPVRREDAAPEPRDRVRQTRTRARREARAGADRRPAGLRREVPRAAAGLARPRARVGARLSARVVDRRRHRPRRGRRLARGRGAVPLPAPARAALYGRSARGLGRTAAAAPGGRRARLRVLQARGRAARAALRLAP